MYLIGKMDALCRRFRTGERHRARIGRRRHAGNERRHRAGIGRRHRAGRSPEAGWPGLLPAVLCAVPLIGIVACAFENADSLPDSEAGMLTWSAETVNKKDGKLFSRMKQAGLNVLYQNFSTDNSRQEQMAAFMEKAMEEGIRVYHLDGDPSWGTDPEGAALCAAVEDAAAYNRRIRRKFLARRDKDGKAFQRVPRLAGVVFDVEPYSHREWDENPDKTMKSFVSGMKKAYALAQEYDLEVILCVPWYYDSEGQQEGLEELVKNGCDSIAVMNYYRGSEIKNIALEAELTRRYEKNLITIYELQRADGHGVKEINTYYDAGFEAAKENYRSLTEAYPEQIISVAFHDYKALKEVLEQ